MILKWVRTALWAVTLLMVGAILYQTGFLSAFMPAPPPTQVFSHAEKACMATEVAESARSRLDAILIAKAVMNERKASGVSACEIFTSYRLLRAPSRAHSRGWAVRDVRVIALRAKALKGVHAARLARGWVVTEALTSGNEELLKELPAGARDVAPCVCRFARMPKNLLQRFFRPAGTKLARMRSEMGKSWRNPHTGTEFFCP